MIITRSIVPCYLENSKFYRSLSDLGDINILIPDNAMKSDDSVNNSEDFIHLLMTLHFWECDNILFPLIQYYLYDLNDEQFLSLSLLFNDRLGYISSLKAMKAVSDDEKMKLAASCKYIDILKYLHIHTEIPWYKEACNEAAKTNRLANLKYLHENGSPWDAEVCGHAAGSGSIECLQYAHENGCPWDGTCISAAENGKHVFIYIGYAYMVLFI